MLICKVCGAANASNTTVCASCGTTLSIREKKSDSNEIFSSKNTDRSSVKSVSSNEIYSSRSIYDEAQQKKIFEKIRKQEEALGDTEAELPKVKKEVSSMPEKPVSQVKAATDNSYKSKPSSSKNHRIPQRIIESVDKQMIQQKMKPTCKPKNDEETEDGKVELTSSKVIEEIHEKHEQTLQMRKLKAAQQRKTPGSLNDKELQKKRDRILEKEQNEKLRQLEKKRIFEEKQAIKSEKAEASLNKKENSNKVIKPSASSSAKLNTKAVGSPNKPLVKATSGSGLSNTGKILKNNSQSTVQKSVAPKSVRESDTSVKNRPLTSGTSVQNKNISGKTASVQNPTNQKRTVSSSDGLSGKNSNNSQISAKKAVSVGSNTELKTKPHSGQSVRTKNTKAIENKTSNKNVAKSSSQVSAKSISVSKHSDKKKSQDIPSYGNKIKAAKSKSVCFEFSEEDIAKNRYTAALSYIGILFIIPYAKRKESDFCKAHAKQGMLLFIIVALFLALTLMLVIGLRFLLVWYFRVPYIIYSALYYLIFLGSAAAIFIPVFKGAGNAINGTYSKITFIGKKTDK